MAGLEDTLRDLSDDAYAAAFDDAAWLPWSERAIDMLSGAGGSLNVLNTQTGTLAWTAGICRLDAAIIDDYRTSGVYLLDPQVSHALSRTRSCVYLDSDHIDPADPSHAEYTGWLAANAGWGSHMTALVLLDGGRKRVGLSINRHITDGATPPAEQAKLAALLPRIGNAMRLGFQHGEKLADAYWNGLTTGLNEPALLLDEHGRLLRSSPAMQQLVATADGLDLTAGRLRALHPADDAALDAAIRRCLTGATGTVRITRRSGRAAYILTFYPLPWRTRMLAPAEAAMLVTIIDPAAPPAAPATRIGEAFDLTPREAELAIRLMAGHSVESAAAVMTIGLPTARIHLRRILQKTGTARQTELLRLLARFR